MVHMVTLTSFISIGKLENKEIMQPKGAIFFGAILFDGEPAFGEFQFLYASSPDRCCRSGLAGGGGRRWQAETQGWRDWGSGLHLRWHSAGCNPLGQRSSNGSRPPAATGVQNINALALAEAVLERK